MRFLSAFEMTKGGHWWVRSALPSLQVWEWHDWWVRGALPTLQGEVCAEYILKHPYQKILKRVQDDRKKRDPVEYRL